MSPYYADDWLTVYHGDARAVMAEMEPESVHCVVTSPPYWGLRDYGTASWVGGDEACDHLAQPAGGTRNGGRDRAASGGRFHDSPNIEPALAMPYRHTCGKCGAIREDGQLGLEPTPEAYVESMVAVFREVRRVLRSDGTVWLNLGDSYFGTGKGPTHPTGLHSGGNGTDYPVKGVYTHGSLKEKDLVGIPWRVAFALQADGWYLRSDIIWSKPNPMPESVTDRPTKSHEYLFLLSKSPRYFFDADAVREQVTPANAEHNGRYVEASKGYRVKLAATDARNDSGQGMYPTPAAGRNIRSVWTVATAPYPGAHFATFPPKLIEPCIKAGTSERGVCPECGAPWEREIEREPGFEARREYEQGTRGRRSGAATNSDYRGVGVLRQVTTGWRPGCRCEHDGGGWAPVGAVVLDPFAGSGTTGMVAQSLSRRAVLIDLSMDYLGQLMDRNRDIPLGLGA